MSEIEKNGSDFVGYEYKELQTDSDRFSLYLDSYRSFGWQPDANIPAVSKGQRVTIKLKRDRKILNKTELTRLQQHFEACMNEMAVLEKSKTRGAYICALSMGIIGTIFMAGSTFAITNHPPLVVLCVLLAIPGFLGWILPYFVYRKIVKKKTKLIQPLMEQKHEEIYEVCRKGNRLL